MKTQNFLVLLNYNIDIKFLVSTMLYDVIKAHRITAMCFSSCFSGGELLKKTSSLATDHIMRDVTIQIGHNVVITPPHRQYQNQHQLKSADIG